MFFFLRGNSSEIRFLADFFILLEYLSVRCQVLDFGTRQVNISFFLVFRSGSSAPYHWLLAYVVIESPNQIVRSCVMWLVGASVEKMASRLIKLNTLYHMAVRGFSSLVWLVPVPFLHLSCLLVPFSFFFSFSRTSVAIHGFKPFLASGRNWFSHQANQNPFEEY